MSDPVSASWENPVLSIGAYATVAAQTTSAATPLVSPLVLVDGVPEPRLCVVSLARTAPLDVCEVAMEAEPSLSMDRLASSREVLVAHAHRLCDGQVLWRVLACGRGFRGLTSEAAAQKDMRQLTLRDAWSEAIGRDPGTLWRMTSQGTLAVEDGPAWIEAGAEGNRSLLAANIHGQPMYALQAGGVQWTVGQALKMVAATVGVTLGFGFEARRIAAAPLAERIDLRRPLGRVLEQLLVPQGLTLHRTLERIGPHTRETFAVRRVRDGRRIAVSATSVASPLSELQRLGVRDPSAAAMAWTARAAGWLVESTFELVAGWNPLREGQPDAAYSRSGNAAFDDVADVYRRWSLNEHGRFSDPPFDRGPAFDLGALFSGTIAPQALRFESMLALDDGGRRRDPLVEVSLDNGATWAVYDGSVGVLTDEASVYFDDATLPGGYFAAAKTGVARVRITATLRSPAPVEVTRWRGNAFAGSGSSQVTAAPKSFAFRRVDPKSVNFAAVRSGERLAIAADDRIKLDAWLMREMSEAKTAPVSSTNGHATLELVGDWSDVEPGDRVDLSRVVAGLSFSDEEAVVRRVHARWRAERTGDPVTVLEGDPVTVLELEARRG